MANIYAKFFSKKERWVVGQKGRRKVNREISGFLWTVYLEFRFKCKE